VKRERTHLKSFTMEMYTAELDRLKRIAEAEDCSVAWLIRRVIRDFTDNYLSTQAGLAMGAVPNERGRTQSRREESANMSDSGATRERTRPSVGQPMVQKRFESEPVMGIMPSQDDDAEEKSRIDVLRVPFNR
jgi:predicted transcriptional regulator